MIVDPGDLQLFEPDESFGATDENALYSVISPPPTPRSGLAPLQIVRVWCKNFKGFEEAELVLGEFSVLVGTNSSGKSSLMQVIALGHRLIQLHAEVGDSSVRFNQSGRLLLPEVLPVAAPRDMWFRRQQRVGRAEAVRVIVGIEYEDGLIFEFGIRSLFGSLNSKPVSCPAKIRREQYDRIVRRPPVIVPAAVGVVVQEEYRTQARRAALVTSGRHNEVIRNLLHELHDEHEEAFNTITEILRRHFTAVVGDVYFDSARDQFITAVYEEAGGDVQHDVFSAGSGFLQVLQLLTFAFVYDAGLLALDEPDAHLHSSLQQIVVRILEDLNVNTGMQVLLATHSKEIINFVDSGRLIPIRKGETKFKPLASYQSALELLQELGAVDNVDAYSLLLSKRCVFFEGQSDERYLKRFASRLNSTIFEGDTKIVPIRTDGVTETRHLQQLDVFERLAGIQIASLQIVDRDGLTDRLLERVTSAAVRPIHVLERDSIENYLLVPTAVARVVRYELHRRERSDELHDDVIVALMNECADDLREETIDRSTTAIERFYLLRRLPDRPSAGELAREAREHVSARFETFEGKLASVEGRGLLSVLKQKIQERYQVSFSNDRLAEELSDDEIAVEIHELIRRLEALSHK